ncbi:GNAT family protein [Aurantimonas sp. Leaf443]|uniref:GNAT family N-acetyltransferase n=1 Tax=Aurantimonas sp. Leaf443 TaxID=1736378 RepID=UPI0006F316A2|nr:GNAT family protein [Aurantimonas sp. Leaf443]KQT85918.1 GNAT family acetyltransferase [Aurantimonas sp. Leaf443]
MTEDLSRYERRALPGTEPMHGRAVRVEPIIDERHFADLARAFEADPSRGLWRWLAYGPFEDRAAFLAFARTTYLSADLRFHAIVPEASGRAEGVAALMRADVANGVVEIGHVCLSPALQGTRAASEAFYLLARRVFDELGYRRYEWKCDDGNAPSKRAAARLGFTPEGLFRQHMIVKGRNRDTAWFSILDGEWPRVKAGFEAWLQDGNFDAQGRQKETLAARRDRA